MFSKQLITLILVSILTACSSINDIPVENNQANQSIKTRNAQLSSLNSWAIAGKIAFITSDKRQSATLHWQKNADNNSESLNLSTVFGIQVLAIDRKNDLVTLEVDGQQYNTDNLDQLIHSLTGLNLPTQAMGHWLKGLAYLLDDKVTYHSETLLPTTLTSRYNQKKWQLKYSKYHYIGPYQLAKQLTISQGDLRIKIAIHSWKI